MKRDYLKNLDIGGGAHLSDELIEQIMAEDGKAKSELQNTINTLTAERDGLKTQLSDANTAIQSYKDMDIDGIKKAAADWETKYDADTKALKDQLEGVKYGYAVDNAVSGIKFTSDSAKKAFVSDLTATVAKIIGIDVSEHNGSINWAAVKKAGVSFAFVRTGYGVSHVDNYFKRNMEGALAQGIPVGIYHFSYALNAAGAKAEAEYVLKLIQPYKDKITLPVFYDFEYDTVSYAKKQGVTLDREAFNAHTVAFCETIKAAGYTPGTYYNLDYLRRYVDINRVGGYVQWYAQYASTASAAGWAIWQYSSSYTIPGCSGRFDVNVLGDASLLAGTTGKYTIGWHRDSKGWWYADSANTYYKEQWAKIKDKWYYFNKEGYMLENAWKVEAGGDTYYLGAEGDMQTNMIVGLGSDGKLQPIERYYHLISELPDYYRTEVDKLVATGKLKGKAGEGEELVLDLSESAVRVLIILNR